jgi:hypothetical protein
VSEYISFHLWNKEKFKIIMIVYQQINNTPWNKDVLSPKLGKCIYQTW